MMLRYFQGEGTNNCFAVCIGCLVEQDPATIPNFCFVAPNWRKSTNKWLSKIGMFYLDVNLTGDARDELIKDWGWHVISGEGPRGNRHSVIGYQGEVEHDPYPNGGGLIDAPDDWDYGFLIPTGRPPELRQPQ